MKDFKTLPKMKTGGRVKKYETGGKVSAADKFMRGAAAAESLSTDRADERSSDAINIETYGKPKKHSDINSPTFVEKALDAADNEKAREASRGIQTKKRGGKVTKKKK